ncbi:MAG: ComEC/Rec2 family competence protein [Verrucomicrobiota bacterium]
MFIVAAGMVAVVALNTAHAGLGWFAALCFSLLIGWLIHWRMAAVTFVLAAVILANTHYRDALQRDGEAWLAKQEPQRVEARLLEDAKGASNRWHAIAKICRPGEHSVKVQWLGAGDPPPAGTELISYGVFKALEPERNPGVPDRMAMMRAEGVIGSFRASEMREQRWIGPISKQKAAFKTSFHHSIVAGIDPESTAAKVIRAVVIGEKSPDSLGLIRAFFESGTLHVFSVSGLHVTMVGGMFWALLSILRCPRRWAIPVIIFSMFGYVWLTGNAPAALRAAWMSAVFLGAFMLRRRPDLLNSLGTVLLFAMLWNPGIIRFPGVQLSYGVVAAIGLGTALARRCFDWIAEKEELLPNSELSWLQTKWLKFREYLANSLAVSLAASVGSTPLAIFHFGVITPVSVLATVFLVFQVFILLAIALISALVHPVWPDGSEFLNRKNAIVADACAWSAGAFAKIPGAWATTNAPDQDTLIIYDLDYGADAACFTSTQGNAVMIDAGGKFSLQGAIGMSLNKLGMRPDSVIFTHADASHVAPPQLMLEMFPIRQVVLGMPLTKKSVAQDWENTDPNIRLIKPHRGSMIELANGARAEVLLSPHDQTVGAVADDRCLVFMIHWKGWKLLWLGDAGRLSEQALLENGIDLKADLIVAGLHQSDFSLTKPFIDAVSPQAIIIPSLAGSKMDGPRLEQTERLRNTSLKIIDRQKTGGLTLTVDEHGRLVIDGYLDKSSYNLRR